MSHNEALSKFPRKEIFGVASLVAAVGVAVAGVECESSSHNSSPTVLLPEVVCKKNEEGARTCSDKLECRELFRDLQMGQTVTISKFEDTCFQSDTFTIIDWK